MDSIDKGSVNDIVLRHVISEDAVVRAYVYAATRGHRDTEDVIQEVWQVVCRKIGEYDSSRSFRAWVLGITRLQVLKWRQAQARSRLLFEPDVLDLLANTADEERQELDHRSQFLRTCLGLLPPDSRRLLHRKYVDGMTVAAIAAGILAIVGLVAYSTGRPGRPGRPELAATAPPPTPAPPQAAAPAAMEAAVPAAQAEGRLTEISGEVWVARADGEGQPVPAEVGRQVFAGEAIVTGTNASAEFAFVDGSLLHLYRRSAVVLSRDGKVQGIDLRAGALDATVRPRQPAERLRVLGALMQADIVGTEFRLMADSRSRWLGVRTGVVEASRVADGQKVALQAGNYAAVAPNWPYMRMDARVCPYWKQVCQQAAGTPYP